MNNSFLIPANTKQSSLYFGMFNKLDLIVIVTCVSITLPILYLVNLDGILTAVLALSPVIITALLVMPLPNYHNMLTIMINAYKFITNRQKFIWKGWCFYDIKDDIPVNKATK